MSKFQCKTGKDTKFLFNNPQIMGAVWKHLLSEKPEVPNDPVSVQCCSD